ncbi:MAG TPA: hypothetical protein VK784_08055 [Pseudonocardiaceae bacterium]|nr:hypothetical protein [Pseudonocardiaceae bacterium]
MTEAMAIIVLAGLAWWCWHRGVHVTMHRGVALSRVEGSWWAVAIGAATLAGILLLDAGRQVMVGDRVTVVGTRTPSTRPV